VFSNSKGRTACEEDVAAKQSAQRPNKGLVVVDNGGGWMF